MKKTLIILGTVLFSLTSVGYLQAEEKVGFVDLSSAFDGYQKTKDYDSKLEKKQQEKEKERDAKIQEIKELQNKISLLNDKEKEKTQQTIDEKIKFLQEFDRQVQTDLRKERDDLIKEILGEIEKVINEYAQKENYTLIFNDRILLYGNDALNITTQILNSLNDKYSKVKK